MFFADLVERAQLVRLEAGHTMLMPAGLLVGGGGGLCKLCNTVVNTQPHSALSKHISSCVCSCMCVYTVCMT